MNLNCRVFLLLILLLLLLQSVVFLILFVLFKETAAIPIHRAVRYYDIRNGLETMFKLHRYITTLTSIMPTVEHHP